MNYNITREDAQASREPDFFRVVKKKSFISWFRSLE